MSVVNVWHDYFFCLDKVDFLKLKFYMKPRHLAFVFKEISFLFKQVDKHIRKLDADLARFEADLKEKNSGIREAAEPTGKKSMFLFYYYISINHTFQGVRHGA